MRHLLTLFSLLFAAQVSAQTMFMQRFKLPNGDSATINVSEVRVGYEMANGAIQLMYGYPNSSVVTATDFDDAVANSCGNLVSVVTNQQGVNKRMAINPQWLYRVYRASGQTRVQMREGNQVFVAPGSYEAVTALFDDCLSGSIVSIDTITISGDTICITLSTDPVPVCLVTDLLQHLDTAALTAGDTLLLSLSDDGVPASAVDLSKYSCRWRSVKCAMPYYGNSAEAAFDALVSHWTGRVGEVVVDTTVVLDSSRVVPPSVRFVDAGNISMDTLTAITFQGYVAAEPEQHIFTGAGTYSFAQKSVESLYPYWFGALGNGTGDDWPEIQKTVSAAVASKISKVRLLSGVHPISRPVVIRNPSGFVTLDFAGVPNSDSDYGTALSCTDTVSGAVFVQGARNVVVSDMALIGEMSGFSPTIAQIITLTDSAYTANLGRDSRYSPYSGVVIDPFKNVAPADGGYPGETSFYALTHSTSSGVVLRNLNIRNFVSGVTVSPSGSGGNGAEIDVVSCLITKNKYGVITCSAQNRAVNISNSDISFCRYAMIGNRFGALQGAAPAVSGGSIGYFKYMFAFSGNHSSVRVSNVYSEGGWSLGLLSANNLPVSFTNCEIKFITSTESGVPDAPCVLAARDAALTMIGGSLLYTNQRPVNMAVGNPVFKGTKLNRAVLNFPQNSTFQDAPSYEGARFFNFNNSPSLFRHERVIDAGDYRNARLSVVYKDGKIAYSDVSPLWTFTENSQDYAVFAQTNQYYEWYKYLETESVTIDTATATGIIVTNFPGKYRVGDILNGGRSTRTPDGLENYCDLGLVSSVSNDTVRLSHVPMGVTTGTKFIEIFEPLVFTGTWKGSLDSGSNRLVVTSKPLIPSPGVPNVTSSTWLGRRVYSKEVTGTQDSLPRGYYAASVTDDTIFLSGPSLVTADDVEFFNADMFGTLVSNSGTFKTESDTFKTVGFQTGDVIEFPRHPYRRKAVVTDGGFSPKFTLEFRNIFGALADIPSPEAIDTGLTYFVTDYDSLLVWNGSDWVGVNTCCGAASVNLGNSDLVQDDQYRYFNVDPSQFLMMGNFPDFPSTLGQTYEKGLYVTPDTVSLVNVNVDDSVWGQVIVTDSAAALFSNHSGGVSKIYAKGNTAHVEADSLYAPAPLNDTLEFVVMRGANGVFYRMSRDSLLAGAGGNGIYGGDGLLPDGGTTVGLDSGSIKFQIPNDAAIRYGAEFYGHVDNTANRFLSMKVDNGSGTDSLWVQEDGNGFRIAAQNRDLIHQTSERHVFIGDSVQWNEGIVQTVTLARFLLGMTPGGWQKRFDANTEDDGTFLKSNSTDWVEGDWLSTFSSSTQNSSVWSVSNAATNANAAVVPKGTGAFLLEIPDGTSTGGNSRGNNAVDLQLSRNAAAQVASGEGSFLGGGRRNTASGTRSWAIGGSESTVSALSSGALSTSGANIVSGVSSIAIGGSDTISSGIASGFSMGTNNRIDSSFAVSIGFSNQNIETFGLSTGARSLSYLHGQSAHTQFGFNNVRGSAQMSDLVVGREITGESETELFLDGNTASAVKRMVLRGTNRVWTGTASCSGVVTDVGNGSTIVAGDTYAQYQTFTIKRVGTATTLMTPGTGLSDTWADTNMGGAAFTLTADDTNESLKITFTPPTLGGTSTVCRAVCAVRISEVGF